MSHTFHRFFFAVFLFAVSAPLPLHAIGGGGGGSQATCESDVWVCTEWNECSAQGTQTRVCAMTFDCAGENVVTARPQESRSCTPAPPPPAPAQRPGPPPRPLPPPPAPSCTEDTWNCEEWQACDPDGNQIRRCAKTKDCPAAETPAPRFVKPCETLQCGNLATIRERVFCRMNLSPAGIARELQIEYLPEACRPETGDERAACIARYKSYQPCWSVPDDVGRNACARAVLKLGASVTPADRDKVFAMIIFRFYNLEKRAEDLTYKGADIARVAAFVTFIQEKKIAFYGATSKAERRRIILDVRDAWRQLYLDVKPQTQ